RSVESVERARDEITRALEMQPRHITAHNNRAIAILCLAVKAQGEGRAAEAEGLFKAALADTETAIALALERFGPPGYDKGWANKAYVLGYKGDFEGAAAAVQEARKINPSYTFQGPFAAMMAANGHPVPPPAAK
ncbi:MAG TPA: hypothetical protein VGR00_12520, partial [Thermoanaerobaculia bacterium]|nr:hypothetical protein [Thermoanaerobaculia bacterium]